MTTYKPKSEFLQTIIDRGFFHQCTDLAALDKQLMHGYPVSAYIGFDATADSLHVGSLMQIMMLRWLQKSGHRPIVLMGGGTTKVGDPSGKDESRQLLDTKAINKNIKGIMGVFDKYITFGSKKTDAIQLNNADWLDKLKYVEFLRDIGRHFTINKMMTMESVKSRLDREQPLTFLEFNYMLLQSYDYLQLHKREGCELQIGGSDQWGNIVNGIDLVRRVDEAQTFGLTSPLLTKADGSKMGKTASGAIWLDAKKTSPYDFWQFWRNTSDDDVGRFLKIFTELNLDECKKLGELRGEEINEAKIILANKACALCHGKNTAEEAEKTAKKVFEEGGVGSELPTFTIHKGLWKYMKGADIADYLLNSGNSITEMEKSKKTADDPWWWYPPDIHKAIEPFRLLVEIGFANSGKDAKRKIASGSVRIDDVGIKDPNTLVTLDGHCEKIKVSVGKKQHAIVEFHD